jgi:hypothetical protein
MTDKFGRVVSDAVLLNNCRSLDLLRQLTSINLYERNHFCRNTRYKKCMPLMYLDKGTRARRYSSSDSILAPRLPKLLQRWR